MAKFDGKAWDLRGVRIGWANADDSAFELKAVHEMHIMPNLTTDGDEPKKTISLDLPVSFTVTFKLNPYPVVPVMIRQNDGTFKLEIMPLEWLELMLMFKVYGVIW